ncbi:phosphate starvation-inducible protein PhoH [Natronincola peptidivorans]|uniref:PhoH-like protein n=2 Tax=Natronincola peptidivorans TaxID=426128 RepID=A0A1I0E8J3_9FIRM|nr:PhoH family protein [Natronincola peptidivorans]SET41320.1 phosphate starvation-inducible protein PhoH [Natronincola peptidivorans]
MEKIRQKRILVQDMNFARELFGNFDENIKTIKKHLKIDIISREGEIILIGEEEDLQIGERLITELQKMSNKGENLNLQNVTYILTMLMEGKQDKIKDLIGDAVIITAKGKPIKPKTIGQKKYLEEISSKDLTFGVGPAGTGKTYLAVAMAVKAFRNEEVNRIILTRPAVEAGESLGFLPGDLKDKVDPYLRPLYDALFDVLGVDKFQKYMERGLIEVAPLAYMRGRTLDNSFIILDEAQNTTKEQMKMFLTRLGFGSKAVVTGDITQIDLPRGKFSGLKNAVAVLKDIHEIGFCFLTEKDVVRHQLVQKIIKAYDIAENKKDK